jgi:hypothetical protein
MQNAECGRKGKITDDGVPVEGQYLNIRDVRAGGNGGSREFSAALFL